MGWAYRALEVGGTLVFFALIARAMLRFTWFCAFLVGLGPLVGYVLTRTTGLPQATDDKGNWGDPLGIASLVVEAALILVSLVALRGAGRHDRVVVIESYRPRPRIATGSNPARTSASPDTSSEPVSAQ